MPNFSLLRRDRRALKQLLTSIMSGKSPEVAQCKEGPAVLDAWRVIQSSNDQYQSRIGQLERELEDARELLRESAASASAHEIRFDLVNLASSEGLWDMEVVAGDPVNPGNRLGGRSNFAACWDSRTKEIFRMCSPVGPIGSIRRTSRQHSTPSLAISTTSPG